ncbi:MAG: 4'-phosphopantetheinyl transferase superfamily protein [Candidatus Paracaedibacteraceae bacterium]|nr:4'-phosphopantetheinyl transferase superfamily protein [Candidatus Paracaedibacteraceae bacterium]
MKHNSSFLQSTQPIIIEKNCVHVWHIPLDAEFDLTSTQKAVLSPREIQTAEKFRDIKHQRDYIYSHIALRHILSAYLDCSPHQIPLTFNKYNKPYLKPNDNPCGVEFNFSKTHGLAICALTREHRVGIDVECIRPIKNQDSIAKQILSLKEQENYFSSSLSERQKLFFQYWTLKESFIKAIGVGFSFDIDKVTFSLDDISRPSIYIQPFPEESSLWSSDFFSVGDNHYAALSTKQAIKEIDHFVWNAE